MATIPSEQAAAMMGMAYFTDGISDKVKAFFGQEDIFAGMSRENIHYLLEMMETIEGGSRAGQHTVGLLLQ